MTGNLLLNALASDVVASLRGRLITFEPGQILRQPGEPASLVLFPRSGVISLMTDVSPGCSVETSAVGCEGAVGHLEALDGRQVQYQAVGQIAGDAWTVEAAAMAQAVETHDAFRHALRRYTELVLAEARQDIACRSAHHVEGRLARWLLELSERAHTRSLALSQELIANLMGVQRTTINAAAGSLKAAKAIRYSRGCIHILDHDRLGARACVCHAALEGQRRELRAAIAPKPEAPPRLRLVDDRRTLSSA